MIIFIWYVTDIFVYIFLFLEIKLKEYGSEIIEVNDNGSGVVEENFEGLSKYYLYFQSQKWVKSYISILHQ